MALRPSLDYTDRDFDALSARLRNLIRGGFPSWTDESVANFGNILVDCVAFIGDNLGFYQDNQALESRITTAVLRRSMLGHSKLLTYKPRGAEAARVELTVKLAAPPLAAVRIVAGDRFRTQKITMPISFQALSSAVIPAGADPPVVMLTVEHSSNATDVFQSSLLPNQEIALTETPFIDGTLIVDASDGRYVVVDNFLESTSTDRHVTVMVDENDRAALTFGNGTSGAIPQGTILCTYKAGGGALGNVEHDTIQKPEKSYTDADGRPVQVTVTNAGKANGGADRQTVAAIRDGAPRSLSALTRSVGREDFEVHARKVPGVARAIMLTANERPGIEENQGQLVIIPHGGGQPTASLRAAVFTMISATFPHTLTFLPRVIGPTYKVVDVSATVFPEFGTRGTPVQKQGTVAQRLTLDAAIRAALTSFFSLLAPDGSDNPLADFGYRTDGIVAYSDVYNVVRDVPNIRRLGVSRTHFMLNGAVDDVVVEPHEFPTLGNVLLFNGFTGGALTT